jgi:Ca2+-binding EF-hand superfamily protein
MVDVELGEFWEKKLVSFGKRMHIEGDGFFAKRDFEYIAERCIELGKYDELRAKQMRRKLVQIWETFFGSDAVNDAVDQTTFVEAVRSHKHMIKEAAQQFFSYWFDVVDTSGDGLIEKEEYGVMLSIIRITDFAEVCAAFRKIDTDSDGKISHDEFVHSAVEYFTTNDESLASRHLFGPLI